MVSRDQQTSNSELRKPDQRTALPDQWLLSAEADVRPQEGSPGLDPAPIVTIYLLWMRQHGYHAGADMGTAADDASQ
jgi:hypothetical protein